MKVKLLLLILLLAPALALGQTYYMHINKADGSTATYAVTDIRDITFSPNGISARDLVKLSEALSKLALLQNRPNPFLANTTIEYQLPKAGKVELKVYNISGQLVKTLVDGQQNAGPHSIRWDGRNDQNQKVAAGSYLYHLNQDNKAITQKMIYLK